MFGLRTSVVGTLSFSAAAGSLLKIVVVLPYSEPHRGGIETQQSMIHLGGLERLKNRLFCVSNMSSPKE